MTVVYFVGEIARRYRRISPDFSPFPPLVSRSSLPYWDAMDDMTRVSRTAQLTVQVETEETAREQKKVRESSVYECDRLDDRHNGLIVADMFSKWGPLYLSGVRPGPLSRSRYRELHDTVLREEKRRTMRTRVFVVPLFAANLPRALTCSDSSSIPLFTFFLSPSIAGTTFFSPKTCSRQLLALLMAVHWQLDSSSITDLYRRGKIDSGDRCGILFQVKGSRRRFCTVTRLAYTYGYILKTLMRFRLGDWS